MDTQHPELAATEGAGETPEDVAVLYSWANLQGAKYRDFSASRREYRAQIRHRQAEAQREAEARALAEAEAAAAAAERAAREAEEAARFHEAAARQAVDMHRSGDSAVEEAARARAEYAARDLARQASTERIEAARRAEAVAAAEAAARREAREMDEARASAQRQAQRYHESEIRRRSLAGPQPTPLIGGRISDPYTEGESVSTRPDRIYHAPLMPEGDYDTARPRQTRDLRIVPQPDSGTFDMANAPRYTEFAADAPLGQEADIAAAGAAARLASSDSGPVRFYTPPQPPDAASPFAAGSPAAGAEYERAKAAAAEAQRRADATSGPLPVRRPQGYSPDERSGFMPAYRDPSEPQQPAWFSGAAPVYAPEPPRRVAPQPVPPLPSSPVQDTLVHQRERVASRWYALKGFSDTAPTETAPEPAYDRQAELRVPLLSVFSMAGGVGKTSLVATLGRALSSLGERVLLADTTSHGLLPFYFGASELRPGLVRTFSPPSGSSDAPIYLVSYDAGARSGDAASQDWLHEQLANASRGTQRVLLDLNPSVGWALRRLGRLNSTVLVPVAPDMNSVISLQAVEKFFTGIFDGNGRPVQPYYVLNQFDSSLALHLDVREVMRQQLNDRLLPFVVRRSPSVSEALAEGMTVVDYAPDSPAAGDYMNLANWLRNESAAPAPAGFKNARWSER